MLTTKEAAELLDITPRRVQELIKNEALDARKASGVWLIDKDSVDTRLRSVTKTGGRPRRGHGKSEIAFTLMNRTHEVAQLVYSTSRKDFTHIGADIDYTHAPIGVLGPKIPVSPGRISTSSITPLMTSHCPLRPLPQREKRLLQSPITPRTAIFKSTGRARASVEFCIRQERT